MLLNSKIKKKILILVLIGFSFFIFQTNINIHSNQKLDDYYQKNDIIEKINPSSHYLEWYDVWGGTSADYGRGGVITDDNGFIYITGQTYSFGSGGYDIFIMKYDTYGNLIWRRYWGTSTNEIAHDITLDSSGDIYITGYQGSSGYNILLLKYDSNGNYQWHAIWGPAVFNEGFGVVVNHNGDIYVTGRTTDDFVLLKYSSTGNLIWDKINTNLCGGDCIVIDTTGFIYISGRVDASSNKYLSKFNSNGILISNHFWGGADIAEVKDMVIDRSSNFYITGCTEFNEARNNDAYIIKLNSLGSKLWNHTWGTFLYERGCGITLDDFGNIYLTGEINTPNQKNDVFIVKFNPYGTELWNDSWGGLENDNGYEIAVDMNGDIYITGDTYSYGSGDNDVFILKYLSLVPPGPFKPELPNLLTLVIALFFISLVITLYLKKKVK
ncbi:MAG: SBBP repeat-containing protein [Candidatus Thorarchaeota archaeon]